VTYRKLKDMTLQELIDHAENLQNGSGISDFMDCYNEMLRRLKSKTKRVYR
jgi:hypothetical protein